MLLTNCQEKSFAAGFETWAERRLKLFGGLKLKLIALIRLSLLLFQRSQLFYQGCKRDEKFLNEARRNVLLGLVAVRFHQQAQHFCSLAKNYGLWVTNQISVQSSLKLVILRALVALISVVELSVTSQSRAQISGWCAMEFLTPTKALFPTPHCLLKGVCKGGSFEGPFVERAACFLVNALQGRTLVWIPLPVVRLVMLG